MNVTVITPPPFEPVSMTEVFLHLRLGDADDADEAEDNPDYALLLVQIEAARKEAEQITQRSFVQQTLRFSAGPRVGPGDYGWWRHWCIRNYIELPRPPLLSVTSVSYFDGDNVLQVVDPASYFVVDGVVPRLQFVGGFSLPGAYARPDALRIEYEAGYPPEGSPRGDQRDYAANVPKGIKQAILLGVQQLYDDLTPEQFDAIDRARKALLSAFRIPVLA